MNRLNYWGFFLDLNTFCSSFWVAKLPAAPAAPRATDLANFLPAPLARDLPTFLTADLPTIFSTGSRAAKGKNPAPLCRLRRLLRTTLVMMTTLHPLLGFFILLGQGIQRLGHGAQEFEEKIASYLGSPLGSSLGSPWGWGSERTLDATAFRSTHSFGSCTRHDVTGTRVSPPFILAKER